MEVVGGGNGGIWGWNWEYKRRRKVQKQSKASKSSDSATGGTGYRFPLKQAVTAGSLALTGDTIAQLADRWRKNRNKDKEHAKRPALDKSSDGQSNDSADLMRIFLSDHDWLRALRMTSYGFLLYGPGSYAWYQYLDHCLPKQNVKNLMLKVLLNQIVLGPCVIAVVFAWNNLWQGKLSQLPGKYQRDAFPTLLYGKRSIAGNEFCWIEFFMLYMMFLSGFTAGFRFWIPVSVLNFWVVPLQARVAFMSMGSIFWNFCLSSTMSK